MLPTIWKCRKERGVIIPPECGPVAHHRNLGVNPLKAPRSPVLPYSSRTSHDQRRCGREAQVLSAAGVCPGLLPSLNTPWAAYGPGCLPRALSIPTAHAHHLIPPGGGVRAQLGPPQGSHKVSAGPGSHLKAWLGKDQFMWLLGACGALRVITRGLQSLAGCSKATPTFLSTRHGGPHFQVPNPSLFRCGAS